MSVNVKAPGEIDEQIGRAIRDRRIGMKISQEKLATELGITFQQVQKYEKGRNRISAGRLLDVARVLDVGVVDLLPGGALAPAALPRTVTPEGTRIAAVVDRVADASLRRRIFDAVRLMAPPEAIA